MESKEGFFKKNKVKDITTCFYADVDNLLQKKGWCRREKGSTEPHGSEGGTVFDTEVKG